MSFVYEQRPENDPRARFQEKFWTAVEAASSSLSVREKQRRLGIPLQLLSLDVDASQDPIARFMRRVSQSGELKHEHALALFQLFTAHMLCVPLLSLKERARSPVPVSKDLTTAVVAFLVRIFILLENIATPSNVDGRVFAALLDTVLRTEQTSLDSLIGPQLTTQLGALWQSHNLASPDFTALRNSFPPSPVAQTRSEEDERPALSMLPFSHPLFDEEMSSIQIEADEESEEEDEEAHLEFSTVYEDTQHWHNHKRAILPPHMGGSDNIRPMDERQKRRQLRSEQRFMSKLQWQAETLTGALGSPLQQIVIPSAASARKSRITAQPTPKLEVRAICVSTLSSLSLISSFL